MILPIIFFLLNSLCVFSNRHQKPLVDKIWNERCKRNSVVLNDCNWCWCDNNQRFQCKARVCEDIDMFGHFKDAIQDIDVGMEGHGAWRSKPTSCTPGVHYKRSGVLCVCDENGNWPNPVCRDLFRVLHPVEVTDHKSTKNETCDSTKLYLVGCNVCYCPSSGFYDPKLCTKKVCDDGDPALEAKEHDVLDSNHKSNDLEVYAKCNPNYTYELSNMYCACLRNNRLICDSNTSYSKKTIGSSKNLKSSSNNNAKSYCDGKVAFVKFNFDCNMCFCDTALNIYCTVKKCSPDDRIKSELGEIIMDELAGLKSVTAPIIDEVCEPGTTYTRGCNTCMCIKQNGLKMFVCSLKKCNEKKSLENLISDCVSDTLYEKDCKICYCLSIDGLKREICYENSQCSSNKQDSSDRFDINALHGYCEPLHRYKKNCNYYQCLSNGKMLMGTSKICTGRASGVLSVDVVPVNMKGDCPEGYSYKLECNTCYCLTNGNALCTTMDCSGENQ